MPTSLNKKKFTIKLALALTIAIALLHWAATTKCIVDYF